MLWIVVTSISAGSYKFFPKLIKIALSWKHFPERNFCKKWVWYKVIAKTYFKIIGKHNLSLSFFGETSFGKIPHLFGLHVPWSHHTKSVFFEWIGGTFLQTFWWTLGCFLATSSTWVRNLSFTLQGLQITTSSGGDIRTILTICS